MGKITLVTGGVNSGKSEYAEKITIERTESFPTYIATSLILDDEIDNKVLKHKKRRVLNNWKDYEVPYNILDFLKNNNLSDQILIDCITMYISNLFLYLVEKKEIDLMDITETDFEYIKESIIGEFKSLIDEMKKSHSNYILVTNEIGLGGIKIDSFSRNFQKIAGEINKLIASNSEEVIMVISGIDIRIK